MKSHNSIKTSISVFNNIFNDQKVVELVKKNLKECYCAFFKGYEERVSEMIELAVENLKKNKKNITNKKGFKKIVRDIDENIFRKKQPYFWFNRLYQEYKKYIRPRKDFERIRKYIKGKKILDFGCGAGYLSLELCRNGYEVYMTDVLNYRIKLVKEISFLKMTSPKIIPFPTNSIDTTIVRTVLHHIEKPNIIPIIKELKRVSKRLIIEEDTYNPPVNLKSVKSLRNIQPLLNQFLSLSSHQQYLFLALEDFFANAVAFGKLDIGFPFQFKTIHEWTRLFQANGFCIKKVILTGFEEGRLHRGCQVWMIVDKK